MFLLELCENLVRSSKGRASCWTEGIIFTHWRFAAGVFVLSTALLIGSGAGAIAMAETDGAAPTGTTGVDGASHSDGNGADTQRNTGEESGEHETKPPESAGTEAQDEAESEDQTEPQSGEDADEDEGSSPTDSDPPAAPTLLSEEGSESDAGATDTDAASSESSAPAPEPMAAPDPDPGPSTPEADVVVPMAAPVSPVWEAVQPVHNAMVRIATAVQSGTVTLASLPQSKTPVTDVLTSFQEIISSVAGAVGPLSQLPSDLATLLGVPTARPQLIGAGATLHSPRVSAAAPLVGPTASKLPPSPSTPSAPLFGRVVHTSTVGSEATTGLHQELSLSGTAPLAPASVAPADTRSLLEHVVSAVLVPASLTALAALALPGVGGLLIVCAAGARVGYRQAKAAFEMRASGIARFAGTGPLGVVRSGSLIVLRQRQRAKGPRVARAVCPKASRRRDFEKVA